MHCTSVYLIHTETYMPLWNFIRTCILTCSAILSILNRNSDLFLLGTTRNLFELVFLFLQKEAFAPTIIFPDVHDQEIDFRRKSGFHIFFPQQRSFCSVLSWQEINTLPRQCRNNHLFQQSLHLLLRDTIRTKFTLQFCLFHTYGDVYAPLVTFMGTWIWERECLLNLSLLFRTFTGTLYIENEGQISTQRFSISNREVVQITARLGVQLIFDQLNWDEYV